MQAASTKLVDGFSTLLLNMGLPGLCLILLGYACYRLAKLYIEVQEKRIAETRTATTALNNSASALNRLSDILIRIKQER